MFKEETFLTLYIKDIHRKTSKIIQTNCFVVTWQAIIFTSQFDNVAEASVRVWRHSFHHPNC